MELQGEVWVEVVAVVVAVARARVGRERARAAAAAERYCEHRAHRGKHIEEAGSKGEERAAHTHARNQPYAMLGV